MVAPVLAAYCGCLYGWWVQKYKNIQYTSKYNNVLSSYYYCYLLLYYCLPCDLVVLGAACVRVIIMCYVPRLDYVPTTDSAVQDIVAKREVLLNFVCPSSTNTWRLEKNAKCTSSVDAI